MTSKLPELTGQPEFLFGRECFVKFFTFLFIYEITRRRPILPCYSFQIPWNEFLAEEEGSIFALRKAVVSDAEFRGISKSALAIKVDVPLETDCPEAHLRGFSKAVIQQSLAIPLTLEIGVDSYRPHRQDGDDSVVVGLDGGAHIYTLAYEFPVGFHHEIQLWDKGRVIPQTVQDIVLQAAGAINVPERFADEVLYIAVFKFPLVADNEVIDHSLSINGFSYKYSHLPDFFRGILFVNRFDLCQKIVYFENMQTIIDTKVENGTLALWWLGQMGLIIKSASTMIVIDYYASPSQTRQVQPPIPAEELAGVDAILGTHNHIDHIDHPSWRIWAKTNPKAKFIFPRAHRRSVSNDGIEERNKEYIHQIRI